MELGRDVEFGGAWKIGFCKHLTFCKTTKNNFGPQDMHMFVTRVFTYTEPGKEVVFTTYHQ